MYVWGVGGGWEECVIFGRLSIETLLTMFSLLLVEISLFRHPFCCHVQNKWCSVMASSVYTSDQTPFVCVVSPFIWTAWPCDHVKGCTSGSFVTTTGWWLLDEVYLKDTVCTLHRSKARRGAAYPMSHHLLVFLGVECQVCPWQSTSPSSVISPVLATRRISLIFSPSGWNNQNNQGFNPHN